MKPDQQKYLFGRLRDAEPDRYGKTSSMPAHVRRAQSVVSRWNRQISTTNARHHAKVMKKVTKVREIIHAGHWDKALAAVTAFEKEFNK